MARQSIDLFTGYPDIRMHIPYVRIRREEVRIPYWEVRVELESRFFGLVLYVYIYIPLFFEVLYFLHQAMQNPYLLIVLVNEVRL